MKKSLIKYIRRELYGKVMHIYLLLLAKHKCILCCKGRVKYKTFFSGKTLHIITFLFVIVGGINWWLIGVNPSYNLVTMSFGIWSVVEQIAYVLVGLSAIYVAVTHKGDCRTCEVEETA